MTTFLGRHSEPDDHIAGLIEAGYDVRIVPAGATKAAVLDEFATALGLPEWFGRNWDALVDALRDLEGTDRRPLALVWDRVHELRQDDHQTYEMVVDILEQVEDEREDLRVTVINR